MPEQWAQAIEALGTRGHLGVLHRSGDALVRVARAYFVAGVRANLLPVIVATAEEAKFWMERALPDPAEVSGREFGLRFVPVPPRLFPAGLLPILESVSEAAVYAEDLGMAGVAVLSRLPARALEVGNEELALQAESSLESLPFDHSLLCVYPNAATVEGDLALRRTFRQYHGTFLIEGEGGISVVTSLATPVFW